MFLAKLKFKSECGYDNNKVSYGNSNNVRL